MIPILLTVLFPLHLAIVLSWAQPDFTFFEGAFPVPVVPLVKENSSTEQTLLTFVRPIAVDDLVVNEAEEEDFNLG